MGQYDNLVGETIHCVNQSMQSRIITRLIDKGYRCHTEGLDIFVDGTIEKDNSDKEDSSSET